MLDDLLGGGHLRATELLLSILGNGECDEICA